jgi:hypothetical protein
MLANGVRGGRWGPLKVFANRSEARRLMPFEVMRNLWLLAKDRTNSGEYVMAVFEGEAESRWARLPPRAG